MTEDAAYLAGYSLCRTADEWRACLRDAQDAAEVAEDYETRPAPDMYSHEKSPLRPEQGALICGISLAWRAGGALRSCYVGFRHDPRWQVGSQPDAEEVLEAYREWCRKREKIYLLDRWRGLRVCHNMRMEDSQNLREQIPWPLQGQRHDTMPAYRITSRGVGIREVIGLKSLRNKWLPGRGYADQKDELDAWLKGKGYKAGRDIWRAPIELAGKYGAGDTCSNLELWELVKPELFRPHDGGLGWWWQRGHFEIKGEQPLADLYELEIETCAQAVLMGHAGSRFDFAKAEKRAAQAQALRDACDAWVRDHLPADAGWISKGKEFNAGSTQHVQRLFFGDGGEHAGFGLEVSAEHMSQKFQEMSAAQQEAALADPVKKIHYAALDVAAMDHYAREYPEHGDIIFMIGVRRKMMTVLTWAQKVPDRYAVRACPDPWWDATDPDRPSVDLIFHQIGTVQTMPGRMSSSDYNGQNVSADKVLQIKGRAMALLSAHMDVDAFGALSRLLEPRADGSVDLGIRCLFLTREGSAGAPIDMSQIEVRGFAGLTKNKMLCEGYGVPPTQEQVAAELGLLRAVGEGRLTTEEYLAQCVLDPLRHWRGVPIDAHSLVASMTLDDADVRKMLGVDVSREVFDDVLQLVASDEERAALLSLMMLGDVEVDQDQDAAAVAVTHARKGTSPAGALVREMPIEAIRDAVRGLDPQRVGSVEAFVDMLVKLRKGKKSITFGIMYGMGAAKLARSLGMTYLEARDFLDKKYFARFPEAKTIPKDIERAIIRRANAGNDWVGWMRNPSGRKFTFRVEWQHYPSDPKCSACGKLPDRTRFRPCDKCHLSAVGAYVAVNRFIQGYAAALYKVGYVRANQLLGMRTFGGGAVHPVTRRPTQKSFGERAIHDETIFMLRKEIDTPLTDYCLRSAMTLMTGVGVPLETSSERYEREWGRKRSVKFTRFEVA